MKRAPSSIGVGLFEDSVFKNRWVEGRELDAELLPYFAPESILDPVALLDTAAGECPLARKDTAILCHATEKDLPLRVNRQSNDNNPSSERKEPLFSCRFACHEALSVVCQATSQRFRLHFGVKPSLDSPFWR